VINITQGKNMKNRLSDYDVIVLSYLNHAYFGHYIDFINKEKYLISDDPMISKMSNSIDKGKPISDQAVAILSRLQKEFVRTKFIRDTLLWVLQQYELSSKEEETLYNARSDDPLKLKDWCTNIPERLFGLTESIPSTVGKLRNFGEKLSEFIEGKITSELPGMKIKYGDTERRQSLIKSCEGLAIDVSYVLSLVNESEIEDPLSMLERILPKQSVSSEPDQGTEKSKYDVFLSYSSADTEKANDIRKALEESDLNCFMADKEIKGGDEWSDKIRKALRVSHEVCLLFSPNSVKSEWVLTEWGAAWVLEKRIVPVLLRVDVKDLPERLKALQVFDFSDISRYVNEVSSRLKT
jgi:hypothetical protein